MLKLVKISIEQLIPTVVQIFLGFLSKGVDKGIISFL